MNFLNFQNKKYYLSEIVEWLFDTVEFQDSY